MNEATAVENTEAEKQKRIEQSTAAEKKAQDMEETQKNFIKTANVVGEVPEQVFTLKTGDVVKVHKIKVKDFGKYMQLLSTLFGQLGISSFSDEDSAVKIQKLFTNPMVLLDALGKTVDPLLVALSELTSLSYEDFSELEIEEAFELGAVIWEVNRSFLLQLVAMTTNRTLTTEENSG